MIKKLQNIYFSPTGTTAKISKEISKGLELTTIDYDLTLQKNRNKYRGLTFDKDDLVMVSVPVYSGRIPAFLEDYFSGFKGNKAQAVFVVVYGNRDYDDALLELKNLFEKQGFKGIAAAAFIGEHSYTEKVATARPDADDLKIARAFGREMKSRLQSNDFKNSSLKVKGEMPYKERITTEPIVPQTNEQCTDCGICAESCPMEAISFVNFRDIDAGKCIRCCSCIKKCPENAKAFTHESILKIKQMLIDNFRKTRKEPELIY